MSCPPPWLPRWVSWVKVEVWGACELYRETLMSHAVPQHWHYHCPFLSGLNGLDTDFNHTLQ